MPIKTITVYEASDGARFDTLTLAEKREKLLADVALAMSPLGSVPKLVSDDKGWVHHTLEAVRKAKHALLDLAAPSLRGISWYQSDKYDEIHVQGVAGRIIDDAGGPVATAWARLRCIDTYGREFNQPYHAINGPVKDHVCIDDRRPRTS